MENTLENKAKFFAQYWGQKVLRTTDEVVSSMVNTPLTLNTPFMDLIISGNGNYFLMLTPLHLISDEDAIEIGRIVFERPKADFTLERLNDIIHIRNISDGIESHVCLNYKYSTLNANVFIPNVGNKKEHYKYNIGEIHVNSMLTVAYIKVIDFLRAKGYALPYNGLSVEEQVSRGWVKLRTEI